MTTNFGRVWWSIRQIALVGMLAVTLLLPRTGVAGSPIRTIQVPPCSTSQPAVTSQPLPPTTVATMEQAYRCLVAHYPTGPMLDDRVLLHGAMVGLITYLLRQGLDQSNAVLPDLRGDQTADWQTFRHTYQAIAARLPRDPRIQDHLAQATIAGLVASLHDDHNRYAPPLSIAGGKAGEVPGGPAGPGDFGTGLRLSADASLPDRAAPPLFIVTVDAGSPAARASVRPGDVITAIDGLPPYVGGTLDQSVAAQLDRPGTIHLTLHRPIDGRTMRATLTPAPYPAPRPVTARILARNVAYIQLSNFVDNAANFVFAAVDGLGLGNRLRGIVLDLRGNGGGSAEEPARLLGAFVHDKGRA